MVAYGTAGDEAGPRQQIPSAPAIVPSLPVPRCLESTPAAVPSRLARRCPSIAVVTAPVTPASEPLPPATPATSVASSRTSTMEKSSLRRRESKQSRLARRYDRLRNAYVIFAYICRLPSHRLFSLTGRLPRGHRRYRRSRPRSFAPPAATASSKGQDHPRLPTRFYPCGIPDVVHALPPRVHRYPARMERP